MKQLLDKYGTQALGILCVSLFIVVLCGMAYHVFDQPWFDKLLNK